MNEMTLARLPETSTYSLVSIGRFKSAANDCSDYRVGVKDRVYFREIYYCDESGLPVRLICSVQTYPSDNWLKQNESILATMRILAYGAEVLINAEIK